MLSKTKTSLMTRMMLSKIGSVYAATVAVVASDHGPFSPRVLTQRAM